MAGNTGVWIVGAKGGVATTLITGVLAMRRGLVSRTGVVTETELAAGTKIPSLEELTFGGHDVRGESLRECARQISHETGTIRTELLNEVEEELDLVGGFIRPGVLYHSGSAIESLPGVDPTLKYASPSDAVDQIRGDIEAFRTLSHCGRMVVINLASTEPAPDHDHRQQTAAGIEELLRDDNSRGLIASSLYAIAAAKSGCSYINFTPSPGALLPGIVEMFTMNDLPFMGSDGKTGETLVKSALAPIFLHRDLRVLSWLGYNLLGDRDGEVLASEENKQAKLDSKDGLLHQFLGYPLHTKVAIDYVPSLGDFKTAWDFIHFKGFLDFKMSLQFIWQGCDSILAAPIAIDLVRLAALALQRGESGPMTYLASFFKTPYGVADHDFNSQFSRLQAHLAQVIADTPKTGD